MQRREMLTACTAALAGVPATVKALDKPDDVPLLLCVELEESVCQRAEQAIHRSLTAVAEKIERTVGHAVPVVIVQPGAKVCFAKGQRSEHCNG